MERACRTTASSGPGCRTTTPAGSATRPGGTSSSSSTCATAGPAWDFSSDVCKHCEHAGCLEACPTGSIVRTEFGGVYIQPDICNGCGYCVVSCPFGVVDRRPDDGRAFKCTFCYDRQKAGLAAGVREGLPDAVDSVRRPRRAAATRGRSRRATAGTRRHRRRRLRSARLERRRHACDLPRAGRHRRLQPACQPGSADRLAGAGVAIGGLDERGDAGGDGGSVRVWLELRPRQIEV